MEWAALPQRHSHARSSASILLHPHTGSTATSALGRGLWPPAPSPNQWANPLLGAFSPASTSCPSVANNDSPASATSCGTAARPSASLPQGGEGPPEAFQQGNPHTSGRSRCPSPLPPPPPTRRGGAAEGGRESKHPDCASEAACLCSSRCTKSPLGPTFASPWLSRGFVGGAVLIGSFGEWIWPYLGEDLSP